MNLDRIAHEGDGGCAWSVHFAGLPATLANFAGQVMFSISTFMYVRLIPEKERAVDVEFGDEYRRWAGVTRRFIPRLSKPEEEVTAP